MPHTYADLLALVEASEVVQDASAGSSANGKAGGEVAAVGGHHGDGHEAVIEADDDPHRLARVNLERYATRNDGRTIRFWRDEWYVWKGNRYTKITERELRAKLSQSIHEEFVRIHLEQLQAQTGDGEQGTVQKVSMALVSNVLQATSGMVVVGGETEMGTWLSDKSRPRLISMSNGLVNMDAVLDDKPIEECLRPNNPEWFSTVSLPYAFDPNAKCPRWEAFLEFNLEMDPERIKILQEWAGYLLLPDTGEQKFLILEGEGANGKSVFCAGVEAMLGRQNVSHVPLEVFGERFQLTQTIGKLANIASDAGEIEKAAEGHLKAFTGGAPMTFDRKGLPPLDLAPTARLMIACNNRPRFSDRTDGVFRRMLLIPWRVQVSPEKRVKNMDKVAWWEESGELPGIFLWALVGLERLRKQGGFTHSALMDEALTDYKEETNPARTFLTQFLEANRDHRIKCQMVYSFYSRWAKENGYSHPLSERSFGKEVRRVFPLVSRNRGGARDERFWFYSGLTFTQDEIAGQKTDDAKLF